MWLKLGRSQPKALGDELRNLFETRKAEKEAEMEKEAAKFRELVKSEAEIMFDFLKNDFIIHAKNGSDYWVCDSNCFTGIMEGLNLHSDVFFLYEELKNICERNKIETDTYIDSQSKIKSYEFRWA